MRRILPPYLFLVLFLLSWLTSWGQNNYPVQVQAIAKPPYTTYLADLSSPASEQLYVTLLLKDMQLSNRQVRLKTSIEGPGTRIMGMDNVPAPPVNLLPGSMIQLKGSDLAVYFRPENLQVPPAQYGRPLPEGMYRFCFTVFDYQTNQQLSPTVCSNYAWLQRSEPPLVVLPSSTQPVPVQSAQQIVFQWIPRHSQVSAVEYEITLTEIIVPQGFNGNPQNLFFSQPPYFVTRTSGSSFLYGPSQPPLTPGRLYGYRVQAVPKPGQEGRTSFANDGYSPVGFFSYGYGASQDALALVRSLQKKLAPPTPPDNILKTIKGQVIWSFKKSELETDTEQGDWVVDTPDQAAVKATPQATNSVEKSHVANPLENAQVSILADGKLIGTAKTDNEGKYEIKGFNPDVLKGVTDLTVKATSTEDFTTMTYTVPIKRGQPEYDLGQTTLVAQTFRFSSQLVAPNLPKEGLVLRILRSKDIINRLPYLLKEGNGKREEITYNGKSYVSIATIKSIQAARRIFYNTTAGDHFVAEVTIQGKSPMYYPLSKINEKADQLGNKAVQLFQKLLAYKSTVTVAGKVGISNPTFTPREGVQVTVTIAKNDLVSPPANGADFTKTVTSDISGQYTLAELPLLKKNAQLKLTAVDNRLSPIPLNESVTYTGNGQIAKDLTIDNSVSLIAGVVKDQFGKPVSGAFVKVLSTGQIIRANESGFFVAKAYGSNSVSLQYVAPGFEQKLLSYPVNSQGNKWNNLVGNITGLYSLLKGLGQSVLSKSNIAAFTKRVLPGDKVKSVASAGTVVIQNLEGSIRFIASANDSPVSVKIELGNGKSGTTGTTGWYYKGTAEVVTYKATPLDGGLGLLPVAGELTLKAGEAKSVSLTLEPGIALTGKVSNKGTKGAIKQATLQVQDLPYTAQTDDKGKYTLYVPVGKEIKVKASARKFSTASVAMTVSKSRTENFSLKELPADMPELKTLLGYSVDADKVDMVSDKTVKVSGRVILPATGIFEATSAKSLDFTNVEMEVDEDGNGIPTRDVVFKEVELDLKGYKFAPVMLESKVGLVLKKLATSQTTGLIGGERLRLNSDRAPQTARLNLSDLPRTTLSFIDPLGTKDAFKVAFSSLNTYPATQNTAQYQLEFGESTMPLKDLTLSEINRIKGQADRYVPFQVSFLTFLFDKNNCVLNEQGIKFAGKVHLPNAPRFILSTDDVELDNFTIDRNLELATPTFKISETTPLKARMGSWRASLTGLIISSNFSSVGFAGRISSTDNASNDFSIDKLAYVKQADGLRIAGKILLPEDGYKFHSLSLKKPDGFELAYIAQKRAYEIDGASSMAYNGTSDNKVIQRLFPIEVQRFIYRSNHDMFVTTKANSTAEVGPINVILQKFVFYRGFDITFESMRDYMASNTNEGFSLIDANSTTGEATIDEQENPNEVPYTESSMSWGIGIAGKVEVDIPFIDAKAQASLLVVNNQGKVQMKVDSLDFLIDGPGFIAALSARGEFSDDRQGFEGSGVFKIPKVIETQIDCSFKFYKLGPAKSDIELGLKLVVGTGAPIPMGPVSWIRLGGEVDFNIKERKYYVALMGELVPTGLNSNLNNVVSAHKDKIIESAPISTIKNKTLDAALSLTNNLEKLAPRFISGKVAQIADKTRAKISDISDIKEQSSKAEENHLVVFDRVKLSVLFDIDECGVLPVIKGSAGLKMLKLDLGTVEATVDFCGARLVVGVNSNIDPLKGLATIKVNGLLYVKPDMLFVGCNVEASVLKLVKANAFFALGINAKRSEMPESEAIWQNITPAALDEGGQRLHGINLNQEATLASGNGGFDIKVFSFKYSYYAKANLTAYTHFAKPDFLIRAEGSVGGSANLKGLGLRIEGGIRADVSLEGGYNESEGWNLKGDASVSAYIQNDGTRKCNTVGLGYIRKSYRYWNQFHYSCNEDLVYQRKQTYYPVLPEIYGQDLNRRWEPGNLGGYIGNMPQVASIISSLALISEQNAMDEGKSEFEVDVYEEKAIRDLDNKIRAMPPSFEGLLKKRDEVPNMVNAILEGDYPNFTVVGTKTFKTRPHCYVTGTSKSLGLEYKFCLDFKKSFRFTSK
ncbi:hypothetical protein ACFPMF_04705 [Larkinella bovis]|uniref:Carboxypeptidase regulatory-like domain-containing protein n=1 Tax=Larkinella bovis TaxID=683041 RepID=A0ABW0I5E3_9BACT